jgi:riboflavin kinase / FMN adenylyltransferase
MQIFEHYSDIPQTARGAAIAMGNFDGVHLGHQVVINSAKKAAQKLGVPLGVAVFNPHPRKFFQPGSAPDRLQSDAARARALEAMGVDFLYALPFDRAMSLMSDETFVQDVLVEGLAVCHVSVGADFHYGRDRVGDVQSLSRFGQQFGFSVEGVELQGERHEKFSSSAVRAALKAGEPQEAARILGRPWTLEGLVIRGEQRGRTIGIPTANLTLGDYVRPRFGVYAGRARIDGQGAALPGVINIGVRPTVDGSEERLEIYLFDFAGDLYGRTLEVSLEQFIRDEQKFSGLDALKTQIAKDCETARTLLAKDIEVDRSA